MTASIAMRETNNLHVHDTEPLVTPGALRTAVPITESAADVVANARDTIQSILRGEDRRLLAVVGPCSIHDDEAARDYAGQLKTLADRFADELFVVMRVYFEKPRTTTGWKGFLNDPALDGSCDINRGLKEARQLLVEIADQGLPAATELLDPITPQYLAGAVAWAAIGARTTESQTHRMMASGVSMPVGFKNATDGSLDAAINAMKAAGGEHKFLGVDDAGQVCAVTTTGNPHTHLVLRGGSSGPNYTAGQVAEAASLLDGAGLTSRVMIDCSHGNSGKDHRRQRYVIADLARQRTDGHDAVMGVMIESNLVAGRQAFPPLPGTELVYGQSITDACVDVAETRLLLEELAMACRQGQAGAHP